MEKQKIASYSEYEKTGYAIEDYYQFCLKNDEEFSYTKEEFISKFEQSDPFYQWLEDEWQDLWEMYFDDTCYEADKILGSKKFVKVEGYQQGRNENQEVLRILQETELEEIISKYINADMLEVDVYEDCVEVRNIHHDGTNHYTFVPFNFEDLIKSELLNMIKDKEAYFDWYGDKLYKANNADLVSYLENNYDFQ